MAAAQGMEVHGGPACLPVPVAGHGGACPVPAPEGGCQRPCRRWNRAIPSPGLPLSNGVPRNGVATLSEGEFSIAVLPGAVLDVSCLGYIDQSIGTGTRTEFEIVLQEDVKAIAEVIVTALGLERN